MHAYYEPIELILPRFISHGEKHMYRHEYRAYSCHLLIRASTLVSPDCHTESNIHLYHIEQSIYLQTPRKRTRKKTTTRTSTRRKSRIKNRSKQKPGFDALITLQDKGTGYSSGQKQNKANPIQQIGRAHV